ncbi:hypothetical protein WJX75_005163 [Coccomyxa subellipsoidea]|uniref:Uncharacterized protein n=1 Tax=Coccomyxa subellipsoidea TaxID=248742 RepID=A0ABR2YMN0_9CHLO
MIALACVVELLKARGGMTEDQMRRVLDAICRLSRPQTDMELLRLIFQKLAICCHCKLVGCWRKSALEPLVARLDHASRAVCSAVPCWTQRASQP